MKKIFFGLAMLLSLLLILLCMSVFNNSTAAVYILLASIILGSYAYLEISSLGPKELALIGTLSSFAAVMRVPFAAIPNVQPCTFIVAVSGYIFGPYKGFLVGINTAFISNIFLGQGPWTPWQMAAWGTVGFLSGILGKVADRKGKVMKVEYFAALCFGYGFLFDWIMNLWHVLGFVRPINIYTITAAYISGLVFDIMHAAGNFVFVMVFYEKVCRILLRFRRRFDVSYE
ncbi:MAG: ECF transporter S component [Bacillota bacterium]|nr:ECF transporter S component [Bacillota bacterium]